MGFVQSERFEQQALREKGPGMADMELEVEARESSEAAGVATEDAIQRPESEEELVSAAESAPEITPEPLAPEAVAEPAEAGTAAPSEEKEEAEAISHASPDSPPEGREGLTAAEPDTPNLETRIMQEEPEEGATSARRLPRSRRRRPLRRETRRE